MRASWSTSAQSSLWAGVSRAVRVPSRQDETLSFDVADLPPGTLGRGTPAVSLILQPGQGLVSETLIAYEVGYRIQASSDLFLDVALHHDDYRDLVNFVTAPGGFVFVAAPVPHLIIPFSDANNGTGQTDGVELGATYKASKRCNLALGYSALFDHYRAGTGPDTSRSGRSPRNQATLHTSYNLSASTEVDSVVSYSDSLPGVGLPSYVRADLRLGYRMQKNLRLDLVGQNIVGPPHVEFAPEFLEPMINAFAPRSLYGKLTWTF